MRAPIVMAMTLCVAAVIAGCASIESDVRASSDPAVRLEPQSSGYVLEPGPLPAMRAGAAGYEAAVRQALAQRGFEAAPEAQARYRVSLAYETHPNSIALLEGNHCAENGDCREPPRSWLFLWPGQKAFVHSLTLRFFDRASGHEVYKVVASSRDRYADVGRAMPYLIESVFARMPYPGQGNWRVKLHPGKDGTTPVIVSANMYGG
ncbi:DUF4136 domain-containing protein [Trinickia sp. LjRoot230]|uniref:DUF4136 domain-containing protein n=1 Tax=Trinickia sp. LjRoot230 TaxID=3342288 RepID=UPI003ECC37AE